MVNFTLSQQSTSGGTDRKWSPKSTFPTFLVQEKLLKRYNRYLNLFKRDPSPPTFSYWCATYIQAHFKMRRLNRAYLEYKRTRYVDKDAGLLLVEIKRIGGHKELLDAIDKSVRRIQRAWKSYYVFYINLVFKDLSILSRCN